MANVTQIPAHEAHTHARARTLPQPPTRHVVPCAALIPCSLFARTVAHAALTPHSPTQRLVISSPSQLIMNSLLSQRCVAAGPSPTYRFPSSPRVGSCRLDHRQHGGRRKPISWVLQSWLERHAHRGAPACSASGVCGVGAKVKKEVR
jgi:hypothetical protein